MQLLLPIPFLALCLCSHAQNVGIGTTTPTAQLHTTGTVRFQGLAGTGSQLLYIDSSGRVSPPPTPGVLASNTPVAIPDNGCSANNPASSAITVSGMAGITDGNSIAVRVDISHPATSELVLWLVAPNGARLTLSQYAGAGANYSGSIFLDDAAGTTAAASAPFAGRYKPSGMPFPSCAGSGTVFSFAGFSQPFPPNGNWTLKVFDNATGNVGTLNNWQITFAGSSGFGTAGASGPLAYFKDGTLALSKVVQAGANVGIGTYAPTAALDVAGTMKATNISVTGGSPAVGKVLTVASSAGDAVWAAPVVANTGFRVAVANGVTVGNFTSIIAPFSDKTSVGMFDDLLAMNTNTGVFITPAAGVYQFNLLVRVTPYTAPSNGSWSVRVLLNNSDVNMPVAYMPTYTGQPIPQVFNASFTLKLAANDQLAVEIGNITGVSSMSVVALPGSTTLSGFRLY